MTGLVVDASVAMKWYVNEAGSLAAHRILESSVNLHAPSLMRLELINGMWKNWRKKIVSEQEIRDAASLVERAIGSWRQTGDLLEAALSLSIALDHVIYDCLYLALAKEIGATLITADKRLLTVAPKGWAVALGEWTS